MSKAQKINVIIWIFVAVSMMISCYFEWSKWGSYTIGSFFSSLIIHGGLAFFAGMLIDEKIVNYQNNK